MGKNFVFIFVIFMGLFFISASKPVEGDKMQDMGIKSTVTDRHPGKLNVDLEFGKSPLHFIPNKGQVNEKARFYAKASRYTLWLTKEGLVFDSFRRDKEDTSHSPHSLHSPKTGRVVTRLIFLNANRNPAVIPIEETKLRVNYFIGNNKSKWHCDIPTSRAVLYKNLYKNIDLKVYGIEKQIEYDWIVKPGGNPGDIRFEYKNVKGTRLDNEGNLLIETAFGELMHKRPVSYQRTGMEHGAVSMEKKDGRRDVEVQFKKMGENSYRFEVGEYDKNCELIIDPVVLAYSTYLGGTNQDQGNGIAVDSSGFVYVTGTTESTDFPTLNQYQSEPGDNYSDVFVIKIDTTNSDSSRLVYSTYLGGGSYDQGNGIAVDTSGCAYVTGDTGSTDFPTMNQNQTDQPGYDVFVTKIDTTKSGSLSLVYSTYLGGAGSDGGNGIAVDSSGCAYVTGYTTSTNFPILNGYQSSGGGNFSDVFVTKIDTTNSGSSSLAYSTYLGGGFNERGIGIAVDSSGNAYVTGNSSSWDFPLKGAYQGIYVPPGTPPQQELPRDAFLARIDATKAGNFSLIYSTYLGGHSEDAGRGIALDSSGYVYVTGYTGSTNFPTLNPYQTDQPGGDSFITIIDTSQTGSSSLVYSTYLGGEGDDAGRGIALDSSGYVYVTGTTLSTNFPTLDPYQAYQQGVDSFITILDTSQTGSSALAYSTYLGGDGNDDVTGIALDSSGNVYVTGITGSSNFPILNPYQTNQKGGGDVFVTKIEPLKKIPTVNPDKGHVVGGNTITIRGLKLGSGSDITSVVLNGTPAAILSQTEIQVIVIASPGTAGTGDVEVTSTSMGKKTVPNGYTYYATPPTVVTNELSSITAVSASSGGDVTSDGGAAVTDRGVFWSTSADPTIFNQQDLTKDGTGTGTFTSTITGLTPSTTYYMRAYAGNSAGVGYGNETEFTTQAPWITVISPNGGESWQTGSTRDITWNASGVFADVKIMLWKDGALLGVIANTVETSAGSYAWTVGEYIGGTAPPGTGYTVKIKEKGTNVSDFSDAPFSIAELVVTSPNGGENWQPGSIETITWNALGVSGNLKITLWKNETLVGIISDDIGPSPGSYSWTVGQFTGGTASPGVGYTIKIEEKGTAVSDDSDASFFIAAITITSPNGSENWEFGSAQTITWTAPGVSGGLKITLWKDGNLVGIIANNIDHQSGAYTWTVGEYIGGTVVPGPGYTIRIAVLDESDSSFVITD